MRALVLVLGLALAVAGCGSSPRAPEAAELVPPDALVFLSVDGTDREGWKTVRELIGGPTVGTGDMHYALLDLGTGKPTVISLARSGDDHNFPAPLGLPRQGIRIEEFGDWSVAADPAAFPAVRAAQSGRSLADVDAFQRAAAEADGGALVTAYADGDRVHKLPGELGAIFRVSGLEGWVSARLAAADNALMLDVRADAPTAVHQPRLLGEAPSGALLAISFKGAGQLLRRIATESSLREALGEYRTLLQDLAPAARGEGIIYLQQGALLPTIVLMVETPNPERAAGALRRLTQALNAETSGFLSFRVAIRGNRVLLTNGAGWPASPTRRLVDDQTFKDALAAADAPDEVSWLAYADIHRLAPIIRALSQLLGGMPPSEEEMRRLERLGTLVAFGARSRLVARITIR